MGAFEHDDAMDRVVELERTEDATPIVEALWAAAEIIAALAWRLGPGLLEGVEFRVRGRDGVERETVELATRVVGRVRNGAGSALRELWEEAGQPEEWYGVVDDPLARPGR